MMKKHLLLILMLVAIPTVASAQVFMDPDGIVIAEKRAYQMTDSPTIDAAMGEWADLPWTEALYNDRDFNGDNVPDPAPARIDFMARYKVAWVDGEDKLYLLAEIRDDQIVTDNAIGIFNSDGMEIRLDPLDENPSGEPDVTSSATNIIFRTGNDTPQFEGNTPAVEVAWSIDESVYPSRAILELAVTVPIPLQTEDRMGLHIFFNDNDEEDDSPGDKNAVLQAFPQLWSAVDNARLGIDFIWRNVHYWGGLNLVPAPTVHQVAAGGSIQAAIDAAVAGDIIQVAAGTFTENLAIEAQDIILRGTMTETDTTYLVPADRAVPALTFGTVAYGGRVEHMAFDGGFTNPDSPDGLGFSDVGIDIQTRDITVAGNKVTGFNTPLRAPLSELLSLQPEATVIADNTFHFNNGAVSFNAPNTLLRYNTIAEAIPGGYAVSSTGLQDDANFIDIAYNLIYNARQCGIGWGGTGTFTIHHNLIYRTNAERTSPSREMDDGMENQEADASVSVIYNNTIVGWDSDGIQMNAPTLYFVRNNLIAYSDAKDYDLRNTPSADVDFGLSFQNAGGNEIATLGTAGIVADPLFVDITTDNYALSAGSPAVDAGEADPIGLKLYFQGDGPDIGALETGVPETDLPQLGAGTVQVATAIERVSSEVPASFVLEQNYPNPFNPSTTIAFALPRAENVRLRIFNALGQEIAVLVDAPQAAGSYRFAWDGRDANGQTVPSGVYFYRLDAGASHQTRSMLLVK